jgi:hypothetical protein
MQHGKIKRAKEEKKNQKKANAFGRDNLQTCNERSEILTVRIILTKGKLSKVKLSKTN